MNNLEILIEVFTRGHCDCCGDGQPRRVYTDPETNCRYCLPCLVLATEPMEELPEDPEITDFARKYIVSTR